MADLRVEIAGLKFRNPVFTAAGPTSRDGMTLLNAAAGGAGGLVAKTVSVRPAEVPKPDPSDLPISLWHWLPRLETNVRKCPSSM